MGSMPLIEFHTYETDVGSLVEIHDKYVLARGTMNIDMIQEITQDPQVEKLTGSASVASY